MRGILEKETFYFYKFEEKLICGIFKSLPNGNGKWKRIHILISSLIGRRIDRLIDEHSCLDAIPVMISLSLRGNVFQRILDRLRLE